MKKFRLFFDKDRETQWLNEMSAQGYALSGYAFCVYNFEKCAPGKYQFQIDYTEGWFRVENAYREFMNEMEIEIVALWGPWVFLRKYTEDGPFELYSDVESRIEHYEKIRRMFKLVAILEIICVFLELFVALRGLAIGWGFACIMAALAGAFIRQCFNISEILDDLRSRMGDMENKPAEIVRRKPSMLISLGFLMNALGFLVPAESMGMGFLKGFFHGCAIGCFILGILFTFWKKEK